MYSSHDLKRKINPEPTPMHAAKRPATDHLPNTTHSFTAPPSQPLYQESGFGSSPIPPMSNTNMPRCKSPPLGMTLAHFDSASGGYSTSLLKTENSTDSPICSGMTPAYRPAMERWGSCML
ncbi:hypothetical protein INT44_008047 [Umbelopsis vinacea]|uniref:Uncharacterized protein n=1 Tax=Umbelopsis vinacea TaxID=44442 RepID=A0A8H7PPG4_9FUNG|nr:hypothetical protein INT44_008047 [Umbelopsis vinacea]KAI9285434.1 hypothetical protein BC943DRAFT_323329 [Umbelopsis sp. AD052]